MGFSWRKDVNVTVCHRSDNAKLLLLNNLANTPLNAKTDEYDNTPVVGFCDFSETTPCEHKGFRRATLTKSS